MNLFSLALLSTLLFSDCFLFELGQSASEMIQVGVANSCNRIFTNQTFGILTSPNFPLGYTDNTICQWTIMVADQMRIVISIRSFKVGPGDRLEIVDEVSGVSSWYSLQNPPNDVIYSTGNSVILTLVSDFKDSNGDQTTAATHELKHNRTFYALFEIEGCGGSLNNPSGDIIVPTYIHLSHRSHECLWTITSPKNRIIILNFLQFDLPPGTCLYSKLHIRDGDKKAGYVLGDFCEENPPLHELRTSSNLMYISYRSRPNFLSSDTAIVPTIRMFYRIADACGGMFTASSGSFSAPKRWMDDVYVCNWTINVPHEKQVLLKVYNWRAVKNADYDLLSLIVPNQPSHSWSSRSSTKPTSSMIIGSNRLVLSLVSHRNKSSIPTIQFYCVYEAIRAPAHDCINVGKNSFFMCDEWKYINCDLKCNGKQDCDNGKDEENCQTSLKVDSSLLDLHHGGDHNVKSINISVYFTFLFIAMCVSLIIVVSSLTFNRFHSNHVQQPNASHKPYNRRRSLLDNYPNLQVPPYVNIRPPQYVSRDMCTVSSFCKVNPPYPYSFDEAALTNDSSFQVSLVTVSVANQSTVESDETQSTATTDRMQEAVMSLDGSNASTMNTMVLEDYSTLHTHNYISSKDVSSTVRYAKLDDT